MFVVPEPPPPSPAPAPAPAPPIAPILKLPPIPLTAPNIELASSKKDNKFKKQILVLIIFMS